jgi:hypothetical protein
MPVAMLHPVYVQQQGAWECALGREQEGFLYHISVAVKNII